MFNKPTSASAAGTRRKEIAKKFCSFLADFYDKIKNIDRNGIEQ